MTLLLINYTMDPNSQVLSWQFKVAFALAPHFEKIVVLTHSAKNLNSIPENVIIIQFPALASAPYRWMGGEYLLNLWLTNLHKKHRFDTCFMHMNYKWAYRFAPFFKAFKIPVSFWYAHGAISSQLKLAHYFSNKIITSNQQGFNIPSNKTVYIGQGIDTEIFNIPPESKSTNNILYVGRISRAKNIKKLIQVMKVLVLEKGYTQFMLTIIGGPTNNNDREYQKEVVQLIDTLKLHNNVIFKGAIVNTSVPKYYNDCFLHLSFSNTGSLDKTLLESMAAGCPVLTSNPALFDVIEDQCQIKDDSNAVIADKIISLYNKQSQINKHQLRDIITSKHSFSAFILKLYEEIITA